MPWPSAAWRRILHGLRHRLVALRTRGARAHLARLKPEQRRSYERLRAGFAALHGELAATDAARFTTPFWERLNAELERDFLPYPPFDFLNHPLVLETMFVTAGRRALRHQLSYLERRFDRRALAAVLLEDPLGEPLLQEPRYLTSHNTIHHLYHVARFLKRTGCGLEDVETVIEWGGGYGNMAKLLGRLRGRPLTYVIVDTALFACIQWLYLATVLGDDRVHVVRSGAGPRTSRVNLLPVGDVARLGLDADLFISTWALSESSPSAQDFVASREWFRARHLLIGYQSSSATHPFAARTGELAAAAGARIERLDAFPGNFYAFR